MKISVAGYKAISEERSVELNGLTILSGANSSGKSSFMQPILLVKQTLESNYDAGSLMLDGANVKLTDSSQIISKIPGATADKLSIRINDEGDETVAVFKFRKKRGFHIDSISLKNSDFKDGVNIKLGLKSEEIGSILDSAIFSAFKKSLSAYKVGLKIERDKCLLDVKVTLDGRRSPFSIGFRPGAKLAEIAMKLIHVPGLRGNPERSYKTASSNSLYPGSFEKYVASIIHQWKNDKRQESKFVKLGEQMLELGLAASVDTSPINETRLEIRVSRHLGCESKASSDYVNIADVGFGVSQTLPVLVALLEARKGQVVYIEQPELHLHPKAQALLASIIASAVSERNVKVVIETHSSILLRGIQTLVARKQLKPETVSLYWFTQDKESGQANVAAAKLDNYGAFGDWPEDFDSVALDVEQAYLDAVEEAVSE